MEQIKEVLPVLSGLIALSVALIKIIEALLTYSFKKISKTKSEAEMIKDVSTFLTDKTSSTLSEEERFMLRSIYDILSKTDENGTPLCYDPRDYLQTNREIVAVLAKVSSYQEKTTLLLEHAVNKLNHLDDEMHHENNRRQQKD